MSNYDTTLSSAAETEFILWFNQQKKQGNIAQQDQGGDYDFRGYYADVVSRGGDQRSTDSHYPDTYKKPNHPTFSNESKYATGENLKYAGHWVNERFIPPLYRYPGGM